MQGAECFPDVLALDVAEAVSALRLANVAFYLVYTAAPDRQKDGRERVVRQRVTGCGQSLQLTVTTEDWRKEV